MGLFNNYNKIEQKLLEIYSQMFSAMGMPNAQQTAKDLLNQAIEESKKIGTYNLSPNTGDLLLEKEKTDEKIHLTLEKKRKEGVKDGDIRWWWNLNDVERMMMLKVDEFHRLALHIKCREEDGLSIEKAAEQVRKFHPIYGNPEDITHTKGDDRPLPEELKDRINIYIEKKAKSDPEKYKRDIESSSTFNALVRKEIRAGNI